MTRMMEKYSNESQGLYSKVEVQTCTANREILDEIHIEYEGKFFSYG